MKKSIIYISILGLLLSACTKQIDLKLNSDDNVRMVVDAQLTTEAKAHLVKLTLTTDYFTPGTPDVATGATVTISDGSSLETLTESTPGMYYTPPTYQAVVGKSYILNINYDGKEHKSTPQYISPLLPIDSLATEFDVDIEDGDTIEYYTLYAWMQESPTPNEYYMWKMTINGVYYTDTASEWFFVEDDLVNGNYIGEADMFEFEAEIGDTVELEQYSITEETYDYLNALFLETQFRGGLFDGAPANVPPNIDNGAVGIFIASDIEKRSVIVQ